MSNMSNRRVFSTKNQQVTEQIIAAMRDGRLDDQEAKKIGVKKETQEALNEAFASGEVQIGDKILVNKGKTNDGKTQLTSIKQTAKYKRYNGDEVTIELQKEYRLQSGRKMLIFTNPSVEDYEYDKSVIIYLDKDGTKMSAEDFKKAQGYDDDKPHRVGDYVFRKNERYGKNAPVKPYYDPKESKDSKESDKKEMSLADIGKAVLVGGLELITGGFLTGCSPDEPNNPFEADKDDYEYKPPTVIVNTTVNVAVTVEQNYDAIVEAFKKGFDELVNKLEQIDITVQQFMDYMVQNNKWLKQILEDLKSDTSAIKDNTNEILKQIMAIQQSVENLSAITTSINENIIVNGKDIKAELTKILNAIKSGNGQTLDALNGYMKQIAILFKQVIENQNTQIELQKESKMTQQEILNKLNEILATNPVDISELLAILNEIKGITQSINNKLDKVIGQLNQHFKNDAKVAEYLELILNAVKDNSKKQDTTNEMLSMLMGMLETLGSDFDAAVKKILEAISKNTNKIDEVKKLLEQIKKQDVDLQKEILAYIEKVGIDMNAGISKILAAIEGLKNSNNANHAELMATLKDLFKKAMANGDKNAKDILNAIANIQVSGGDVDLSSIEKMLADLIGLAGKNNDLLAGIDAKMDVLKLTINSAKDEILAHMEANDANTKAILAKLDEFMTMSDRDSKAILAKMDTIINLLNNIKPEKYDDAALMAKLDDILDAIKNHEVTVDVTGQVQCNCGCGSNHEGILGDLSNILE